MRNLLRVNFTRLKIDKVFWSCMVAMAVFGVLCIFYRFEKGSNTSVDQIFFYHIVVLLFAMAVWCTLFIGTDRSDGTLRNKLIAGCSRSSIYLADLITGLAVGLLLSFANIIVIAVLGIPLLGIDKVSIVQLCLVMLLGWLAISAIVGLFTLMAELIRSKSTSAVAALLVLLLLFCLGVLVKGRLDAPEFLDNYVFTASTGDIIPDATPNPAYLTGTARIAYEWLLDALPTGQVIQLSGMSAPAPLRMALCSLVWLFISTVLGLAVFRRRDIK